MKKKSTHMILVLEERNGEYEYCHRSVHKLPDEKTSTMKKCAEKYLKEFYGGKTEKEDNGYYFHEEDNGYYFHEGQIYVRISSYQLISPEEYNVLNKYL